MAKSAAWRSRFRSWRYTVPALILAALSFFMMSGLLTSPIIRSDSDRNYSAPKATGGSKRMTNVGINLAGVNYWGQDFPFIDRIKTINPWTATTHDRSIPNYMAPVDANGYPVAEAGVWYYQALVPVEPASAGQSTIYHLYHDGDARIFFNDAKVISEKPGETIVDLAGTPGLISMTPGPSGKLPTDLHLVRDDQVALFKAGEIFNPAFLDKLKDFSEIRLMDWANTNGSTVQNWADRTQVSSMTWAANSTKDSVPLEVQVALANKLGKNIWINIPAQANDDYIQHMLTYVRDNLKSGLTVKIEYSNEVWNGAFAQSGYSNQQATKLWGEVYDGAEQYYGYRSAQIAVMTKSIFASNPNVAAQVVLGTQTGYEGREANIVTGVARANLGSIGSLFDIYAVTNYWGLQFAGETEVDRAKVLTWAKSGQAGLDAAVQELEFGGQLANDNSLRVTLGWLDYQARFAKANGLSLQVYEGSVELLSFKYTAEEEPVVQRFFQQILADPRIGPMYDRALASFTAKGGEQWDAYLAIGPVTRYGDYGVLQTPYDEPSVRFTALVANAQAGQAAGSSSNTSKDIKTLPPVPVLTDPNDKPSPPPVTPPLPTKNVPDAALPPAAVVENVATAADSFVLAPVAKTVTYIGNASFAGLGNALDNVITGGSGADRLIGLDGNDALYGGAGNDALDGGAGDDTLDGGTGDDTMVGGVGNDIYYVDSDADRVTEQANQGTDEVRTTLQGSGLAPNVENLTFIGAASFTGVGNQLDNVITGGNGGNTLYGDGGNDTLRGGDGADYLDGGAGDDAMYGGAGNDRYSVDSAKDVVIEAADAGYDRIDTTVSYALPANVEDLYGHSDSGLALTGNDLGNYIDATDGNDTIHGLAGNDNILGRGGDDTIDGGDGNDAVAGGDGNDTLSGGAGDDIVYGGAGNDILRGGGGCDTLVGESGADTFLICDGDLTNTLATTLTIADFTRSEGDKIDFRSYDANVNVAGVNPFDFIGTAAFSKKAGELRVERDGGRWIVTGDTNGDAIADFSAIVQVKAQLLKSDFLI